jgi:uncharacterized protein
MAEAHTDQKQVLFIRGAGGEVAHEEDAKLVTSLRDKLGTTYNVRYPQMPDDDAPDSEWIERIRDEIAAIPGAVILVAHSVGTSSLLKYFAENKVTHPITGIFLLAAPFWGDGGWQYEGFTMPADFPDHLPKDVPIFLYHNRDDSEVSFAHLALYAAKLPQAFIREGGSGGHQFNDDLTQVAVDIKNLK